LEIKLREGKKRQIRHMTAAVKLFTLRLVRVAIGPIQLGDLNPGKWREITKGELKALRRI
jgi:23S rRNA pseudouridine2457 synthase